MTVIVAWQDAHASRIVVDSAVTHRQPASSLTTSFGEVQANDAGTVEEAVLKLIRVSENTVAGIRGDASAGLVFCDSLMGALRHESAAKLSALATVAMRPHVGESDFDVLLIHPGVSRDDISVIRSVDGVFHGGIGASNPHITQITPGMPDSIISQITEGMGAIRSRIAEANVAQAMCIALCQTVGSTEVLTSHGVGGAFFGASCQHGRIHWMEDVQYVLYDPHSIANLEVVGPYAEMPWTAGKTPGVDLVRVLVRSDCGLIMSSVDQTTRLFVTSPQPRVVDANGVVNAAPNPHRFMGACRYVAFISRIGKRLLVLDRGSNPTMSHHFGCRTEAGQDIVQWSPILVERLCQVPAPPFVNGLLPIEIGYMNGTDDAQSKSFTVYCTGVLSHA